MLTQWHLLPLLTNTVKFSLFTHGVSSPLSLAARLHNVTKTVLNILTMAGWTFHIDLTYEDFINTKAKKKILI